MYLPERQDVMLQYLRQPLVMGIWIQHSNTRIMFVNSPALTTWQDCNQFPDIHMKKLPTGDQYIQYRNAEKSTISKLQYWNNLSPHFYVLLPVDSAQNKYFLPTLTWSWSPVENQTTNKLSSQPEIFPTFHPSVCFTRETLIKYL